MRALFIQQDHVSPVGPIGEGFAARGYDVATLSVVPAEHFHSPAVHVTFPDPTDYDAIVPMGAPWSVYDHDRIGSWVLDEIDFLRSAHGAGVPILGICFGGQALAAALGGSVIASAKPELGWTGITTSRPDLVDAGPWFEWHSDRWVLPPSVAPIAATDVCDQAFVAGRSLGVQFHPEMTPATLDGWLGNGGATHVTEMGFDIELLRSETQRLADDASRRAVSLVSRFLDVVASSTLPHAQAIQ